MILDETARVLFELGEQRFGNVPRGSVLLWSLEPMQSMFLYRTNWVERLFVGPSPIGCESCEWTGLVSGQYKPRPCLKCGARGRSRVGLEPWERASNTRRMRVSTDCRFCGRSRVVADDGAKWCHGCRRYY